MNVWGLALILWILCGLAGIQLGKEKGWATIPAFWISVIFGPFGLAYLSLNAPSQPKPGAMQQDMATRLLKPLGIEKRDPTDPL